MLGLNGTPFKTSRALRVGNSSRTSVQGHSALIVCNDNKKLEDYFDVDDGDPIGAGGYAEVRKGRNRVTHALRAVKCIKKDRVKEAWRLQEECDIMLSMDHPHIVKIYQTFEDSEMIYLVMEMCEGGELFDCITEHGHLTESDAARIMQQIFKAVFYMHEHGVSHRDFKPENFLFLKKGAVAGNSIKVVDFGLAKRFDEDEGMGHFTTKTGTPFYVAPEVLAGGWGAGYGAGCDIWSCGVVLYVLLSGGLPFAGSTNQVLAKVKKGDFSFPKGRWTGVSADAKDLIKKLICVNVKERFTAEQALKHTWTRDLAPRAGQSKLQVSHIQRLQQFRAAHKFQKVALQVVARNLGEAEIEELSEIFESMDTDGNGTLSMDELREGLHAMGVADDELEAILASVDDDGSGAVDYTEFLAATLAQRQFLDEDACRAAFRVFDRNDDGVISMKELQLALESADAVERAGAENVEQLMRQVDTNQDGYIDFQEFKVMLQAA